MTLSDELRMLADQTDFSGVVAVSRGGHRLAELSRGMADRANRRPNTLGTQFGTASATKGLTALAIGSLIQSGRLRLDTTMRSLMGDALPLVDATVTIEQLLGHTSGVGDYLDEDEVDDIDDHVVDVAVHRLAEPGDYLQILDGYPQKTAPGTVFAYNNGGYVMLSIAVEAADGSSFYEVVQQRVLDPASMDDTAFLRSDELPAEAAIGYLANGRSNVFHLPVRGAGDGGIYSTVADMERFWTALFAGEILAPDAVESFVSPRCDVPAENLRYGRGFWLRPERLTVMLEGMDAGVSFRSAYDRPSGLIYTVISNTSSGAWPIVKFIDGQLPRLAV
jgi:CubicO group peptidase (beta-lactamase class C family)